METLARWCFVFLLQWLRCRVTWNARALPCQLRAIFGKFPTHSSLHLQRPCATEALIGKAPALGTSVDPAVAVVGALISSRVIVPPSPLVGQ